MTAAEPTTWVAELYVTDFGPWSPDDRAAAAALIGMVNRHRFSGSPRPLLFLGRLETGGAVWMLQFELGGESDRLAPGEHLVHVQLPDGTSSWSAMSADMLADLRPAADPTAQGVWR